VGRRVLALGDELDRDRNMFPDALAPVSSGALMGPGTPLANTGGAASIASSGDTRLGALADVPSGEGRRRAFPVTRKASATKITAR
jgi:hypothetical protein